ncbi:MAG: GTPase, partial [Planctomycetota bacterium]
ERLALAGGARCPVLALWMPGPASFTGEDVLEVSCAGSPHLAEAIADALVEQSNAAGFPARRARAGEFALRAHLAGRLGVEEAEALAARIAATADAELAAADEIARGGVGRAAASLIGAVAEALALVEAGIDFTDQEGVVAIRADVLAAEVAGALAEIRAPRGEAWGLRARAVPLVALAGAPNAGKSALFNALLGRTRSVAAPVRGTTRDAIVERLPLGGAIEADLADLAGLDPADEGAASDAIALAMRRRAEETLASADVVVRCAPAGEDLAPLPPAVRPGTPVVEVSTMADRGGAPRAGSLATSAVTGAGVDALRAALRESIRADRALRRAQLASLLPRHDESLGRAESALVEAHALAIAAPGGAVADPELAASLLRAALDALGEVAGPVHPDDVLGLVFSRFCIGK